MYLKNHRNEKPTNPKATVVLSLLLFAAAVILDQITKHLAVTGLKEKPAKVLIDGVFELRYLENRGAAFGMMQDMQFVFVIGAAVILIAASIWFVRAPFTTAYVPLRVCAVLLCAGAVGNLIDRVRLDYVVDFFYFSLIDFPIFNVADCYVVAAVALFAVLILFFYGDDEKPAKEKELEGHDEEE